jgi:hypothetical protein
MLNSSFRVVARAAPRPRGEVLTAGLGQRVAAGSSGPEQYRGQ